MSGTNRGDCPSPKVTAVDVKDALRKRWPDGHYLHVEEAPDGPERLGRKLDVLVLSLWKSRGYELDGVEVKVSMSDWKRELDRPEKADFWWEHVHRFWIAVPVRIAPGVRADLPTGWGLLAVDGGVAQQVVKAEKHAPEPLTWPQTLGVMRALDGAGPAALARAQQRGYDAGRSHGRLEAERATGDDALRRRLDSLTEKVEAFAKVTGIDLVNGYGAWEAERAGRLVQMVEKVMHDPGAEVDRLRRIAEQLSTQGRSIAALADELATGDNPRSEP